ncbi:VanZ family protein [Agromyces sp. MMS24-JH15]|uniref:VanZ family protein n=1 Tax=Agromyces sp. MMS24-JH15 TaxID=3243765 RepID=UPI003748EFFE
MATRRRPSIGTVARVALAPYLVALGFIVFLPAREAGRITGIVGVLADAVATVGVPREPAAIVFEFLANIALFVPLGLLLPLAWPRLGPITVIVAGCALSTGIELIQLAIPSRVSTISDVVANTAGTALGYLVATVLLVERAKRDETPTHAR